MTKKTKKQHSIKIFSTPSCPWCTRVKQYLDFNDIVYQNIDVSKDQQAAVEMVKKSGQQGVPQLWIDGHVIVGFNKPMIDKLLDLS